MQAGGHGRLDRVLVGGRWGSNLQRPIPPESPCDDLHGRHAFQMAHSASSWKENRPPKQHDNQG